MSGPPAPATLHGFSLDELAQFSADKAAAADDSPDYRGFYVGLDDVHGILDYLLSRCRQSLDMNMFGYDDDTLNDRVMALVANPAILTAITLDKSQSGGAHEKRLLDADKRTAGGLALFNTHFAVGQSAWGHQISHTKGGVIDGVVAWEGSTNWSDSGEGTFVVKGHAGGAGYKAQNNTLIVHTNPRQVRRFLTELRAEHLAAMRQLAKAA